MGDDVAKDGAYRIVCTKETERRMGDIVAEDGGYRIVCTKEKGRRIGGKGAFVWCGLRKLYRLSENTL